MGLTASELFAMGNGAICQGSDECHWCAAPCERIHIHDDDPITPFVKRSYTAKKLANHWICQGCFYFRAMRSTISYLHGGFKDGKAPRKFSWWITRSGNHAVVRNESAEKLYPLLLDPPRCFVLALLDDQSLNNHIHQAIANEPEELKTDTPLHFTLNNIPHTYTIYELKEAIKGVKTGLEPGVSALIRWLGEYSFPPEPKKEVGRPIKTEPDDGKVTAAIVAQSGGITNPKVNIQKMPQYPTSPGPRRR